ncbi:EAL domain-containing protein [Vibrio albus]|nr:EAL domain-containing protein [Vibrio albus]
MNPVSYRGRKLRPYLPQLFKHTGTQLILACLLIVGLTFLICIPFASQHAQTHTLLALTTIEKYFDQIKEDSDYLLASEYQHTDCERLLVPLRKGVFQSDRVKEIGVFDRDGRIFCTSNTGKTSFYLYQTMLDRINRSPFQQTLSYTKTRLSKEQSIVLMYKNNQEENGLSILVPPRYVISLVDDLFINSHLNYTVRVITRSLTSIELDKQDRLSVSHSRKYPLEVEVYKQKSYLFYYFLSKSWIAVMVAALVNVFLVLQKNKKLSSHALPMSLEGALQCKHLELYYQPIVEHREGRIVGCEALLRWNDPIQGMISPGIFIPLAEKVGLIEEVTHYVIDQACIFLDEHVELFQDKYISVNISRSVILKASFIDKVVAAFRSRPDLANRIVFEITEDNDFTEKELILLREKVMIMTKLGLRFAVDDFGTGYSGLHFIRQCDFDFLKIDKVFVKNLYQESNLVPVLKSMYRLAEDLNINVIVEGVEETEQLNILDSLGFIYIQGFYFSKPLPAEDFLIRLKAGGRDINRKELSSPKEVGSNLLI